MCDLKICRVCLNMEVRGYKLDEHNLRSYYEHVLRRRVNNNDGLPQWFCYECATMLHKFHKFKEKCYRGQVTLKQIAWRGNITYETVAAVDRDSLNLASPVNIITRNERVKSTIIKYKTNSIPMLTKVEKSILSSDSEDSIRHEDIIKDNTIGITDDTDDLHDDMANSDQIDNSISTDDENIFLDIVKERVKDKSKIVYLDDTEMEPKPKKGREDVSDEDQFIRPKKEYLNPKYWRKINLNEEEAMHDFKQKEHSDQFTKAEYKCQNCFKGFSRNEILMRHLKLRHDEVHCHIECRFCHMRFRVQNQLSNHMKQHYTMYHCLRCDMGFRLENTAKIHEDYHKGVMKTCKYCGKEFKHSSTYYTHLRMSHRSAHLCTVCGASFVSEVGLQQHKKQKHFDSDEEAPSSAASANTYCDKCDIKFASQAAYDEHLTHSIMHGGLTTIEKERKFRIPTTCTHCGQKFPSRLAYKKHHKSEHSDIQFYENLTICEVCGISLAEAKIPSHMVSHTGERPFPCTMCDKRFAHKSGMKIHYNAIHLKQPYPNYPISTPNVIWKKTEEIFPELLNSI